MPDLTIKPPLGGMNRRVGFQQQEPFSSFFSENFWPFDVDTGRAVIATRPSREDFPSPNTTVEGLFELNGNLPGKPVQSMVAAAGGTIFWFDGDIWRAATGGSASSADTGRAVFGRSFLQQTFITDEGNVPIVFDYDLETATPMTPHAGSVPIDCRIAEVWQGSLWLAGDSDQPEILFGSRTGDPYDWDFGVTSSDLGGAFFTAGENRGILRGPINAIVGQTGDTMLVSTLDGLAAMRGHPRRGGIFEQVSNSLFMMGQGAWARTPGDLIFFMSPQGLAALDPIPGSIPSLVSRDKIPDELIGLAYDFEDPTIAMAYSTRWNCIYISDRGSSQAWLYDLNAGGFHSMTFTNYPFVMNEYEPAITADTCGVLFGKSA